MENLLYVVGGSVCYTNWLCRAGMTITDDIEQADFLLFTGGADISPSIYRHEKLCCTWNDPYRDSVEIEIFNRYIGRKPMVGICRGHQFLSAMCGAQIIQDMSHPGRHFVTTYTGEQMVVNSLHHQMVHVPDSLFNNGSCQLLAWAEHISDYYTFADKSFVFPANYKEVEALYWPKYKILTTQNHPEMMDMDSDYVQWITIQLENFLMKKEKKVLA